MDKTIKPIKRLGQNFLHNERVLQRVADAACINSDDIVFEIGTGTGNLTRYLCEKAKFVYTIEKDARLCRVAEENLRDFKNVKVICADILKIDVGAYCNTPLQLKVVGNLPYYITTPIIFHLLKQRRYIKDITIMVQKEVAERMTAMPGGKVYGILSCSVQFYTHPEILFNISKSCFKPQPKVDSAIIKLKILEKPAVEAEEDKFLKVIKAAFSQRRKTLLNSLYAGLNLKKEMVDKVLIKTGINPKRRAETLSIQEFAKLANFLL